MTRKKYFTDSQIQLFADKFVEVLYKRLTHPMIIEDEEESPFEMNGIKVAYFPFSRYFKMNGIRVADAKMICKIATQFKNIKMEKLQKVLLDMKVQKDFTTCKNDYNEYQKVLLDFSKIEGVDKNKFAEKIIKENLNYNTNVAAEFAYNTPELKEDLKESFKQIVKKQDFARYESLEKQQKINEQKEQKKAERQEARKKFFKKLPFNKVLLKQEKPTQEQTQGKE
ncbi:MAG: hypothetical protein PHQ62_04300 [Clostridia bacterium]|nr:hypothetical protein [Clostridia bacterium]